jgi:hypothetical protein
MLDIFKNSAFSVIALTDTISKLKFVPGFIGQRGLFTETSVRTLSVGIEEQDGLLKLIDPTPRGGPGHTLQKRGRVLRSLSVPHFEINDAVYADEVQGIRAFGSETELETVQGLLAERMQIAGQSLEVTLEHSRVGAIKGIIKYETREINLFREFEVDKPTPVVLPLTQDTSGNGAIRTLLSKTSRAMSSNLAGAPHSGYEALCGDDFFDALVAAKEFRTTYLNTEAASELRNAIIGPAAIEKKAFAAIELGGVTWINYRGGIDDEPFIEADRAYMYPIGVPGLFRTYVAPADYVETVNTAGRMRYTKQYEFANGKGIHLDTQTNNLNICTRPNVLQELRYN